MEDKTQRAELGFNEDPLDNVLNDLIVEEQSSNQPSQYEIEKLAEKNGFSARPVEKSRRVHTTGRNQQINIKARQEDIDAFYALANQNDWVLGETFEHCIKALQEKIENQEC